ncbi:hypothetical protein O744_00442 [Staphylococcus aureus M0726]|nr:hypothetical protein O744_00442 [Staphylococcus aureus M0726]
MYFLLIVWSLPQVRTISYDKKGDTEQ